MSRRGFSLIEVIIAIGILSIGLVGAIRVFPVGLKASQRAAQVSRGTLLVQRTLETIKLKTWDELVEGEISSVDEPFTVTVAVDQPDVDGLIDATRLKRVSVRVTWEQEGRPRTLSAATFIRRQDSDS